MESKAFHKKNATNYPDDKNLVVNREFCGLKYKSLKDFKKQFINQGINCTQEYD